MARVFDILHPNVKKLANSRFCIATDIQDKAIPKILKGKNVLVVSGTGTGKSESVFLPILSKLSSEEHKPIALLYLTPLKALNRNMLDRLVWWSHKLDLEIGIRHGDTTAHQRKVQVEYPPHILISTPEQIQSMLSGKLLRKLLANVRYIIIDEVHELVDSKRGTQLTLGLERLKQLCGSPQIIALSATIGSPKDVASFFGCEEVIISESGKGTSIKVRSPVPTKDDSVLAEKIFIGESVASRIRVIHDLIENHTSTLVFTNTRETAEVLSSRMKKYDQKLKQEIHHSSLSKYVREKTEEDFKKGKIKAIICTSSLQLGIDIGTIDLVLQYLSPREVTQLVQRFGRSGHSIHKTSKGIIISGEGDDLFESAVISRRAISGELEVPHFHSEPLDVLAHQIVGLASDKYKIGIIEAYNIIKNAYPYKKLSWNKFISVLDILNKLRMIWINDSEGNNVKLSHLLEKRKNQNKFYITRGRKAIKYYFENLSTIPDSKSYIVINTSDRKAVGTLDENFVAEHSDKGSTFIVKGTPWRVISVENDKVFVEPSSDIESAIPAWEGELIPVPFEVAQEVGKLRERIERGIRKKNLNFLVKEYPISSNVAKKMVRIIKSQKGKPFATDKKIVLEKYADYLIINACFGSRVNETISRLISIIVSSEHGTVILSKTDPYRIILQKTSPADAKRILKETKPHDLETILKVSLDNTSLFKSRFLKVAKRFGVIKRSASLDKIDPRRLIAVYRNTPVYEETMKEIFTEKLDIEKTVEILKLIQSGKIKIIESTISPIGEYGLRYELSDVARPDKPEKEILRVFRNRLLNTKIRLICVNCGKWDQSYFVKDIPKLPRCPKCSSRLIGAVHPRETEVKNIVRKWVSGLDISEEEKRKLRRIKRSADMIINYGNLACVVLAGRGIGPETCARILARYHKNEDKMYKDILKAEREWLANKKYWT